MAVITFPRTTTISPIASLAEAIRRRLARWQLTDQERRNLQLARSRTAVYTASLGGHPFHV